MRGEWVKSLHRPVSVCYKRIGHDFRAWGGADICVHGYSDASRFADAHAFGGDQPSRHRHGFASDKFLDGDFADEHGFREFHGACHPWQ